MKILYLSRRMDGYQSASYQQDVMNELARQAQVQFYGPGHENYDPSDSIQAVLEKGRFKPDAVFVGHSWLSDLPDGEIDPHPNLNIETCKLPKFAFLNKEYVNLNAKLKYIKNAGFTRVFTHHHDARQYESATGVPFTFSPFGFDHRAFDAGETQSKTYDLAFSGILQNQNANADQSDVRVRAQGKIFYSVADIPFFQRKRFYGKNIFWNSIPRKRWAQFLSRQFGKYRFLSAGEYQTVQARSKIFLNALSPMGLISPRFFENMASRSLVLCEQSALYANVFKEKNYVEYAPTLDDFVEKLEYYWDHESERRALTNRAYDDVMKNHTWKKRVEEILKAMSV